MSETGIHSSSWDTQRARDFVRRLLRRRESPWGLSPGGLALDLEHQSEQGAPGWGWLRFAEALGSSEACDQVEARFGWEVADRTERVPARVREGLNYNQKPFHLWNVERIVEKTPFRLDPVEPYRVGGGAADPEQRGMPREFPTATSALAEERSAEREAQARERAEGEARRRVWRQATPYGRPEPEPEPD